MTNWLSNPAFVVYALTCVVLTINVLALWGYSGAVPSKTKIAINKEDAERFGAVHEHVDPPEVARVLRAHAHAQAAIYPFLFLGLVFVLAGGSAGFAKSSSESSSPHESRIRSSISRGSSLGGPCCSPRAASRSSC